MTPPYFCGENCPCLDMCLAYPEREPRAPGWLEDQAKVTEEVMAVLAALTRPHPEPIHPE